MYFSFTRIKIDEIKQVKAVNEQYQKAIDDFRELVSKRNAAIEKYQQLNPIDRDRIERLLPDNVDNVRLIIDINAIASKHSISIKDVKTSVDKPNTPTSADLGGIEVMDNGLGYNSITLSYNVKGSYPNFVNFLHDLEISLRIMDVSKIKLIADEAGSMSYDIEIKTYWLKEIK